MRAPWLVVLVAGSGCGFDLTAGSTTIDGRTDDAMSDGGSDVDSAIDGAVDGMPMDGPIQATCLLAWMNNTISFATPTALSSINTTSYDRDPFVSDDDLTIWFSSGNQDSQGGGDIFKATRTSRTLPFAGRVRDASFSTSGAVESKMSMTEDALFAVVASDVSGGAGGSDIWETTRPNTNASWGSLTRTHVISLATGNSELDPFVTPDGLSIYYAPLVSGSQSIVAAKRTALNDAFSSGSPVAELNTSGSNFDPTLFANDRVIVFASDRNTALSGDNIWYATRQNTTQAFSTPRLVPGVNSDMDDGDPHVSKDGCRIYFARKVGSGVDWELFSASAQ